MSIREKINKQSWAIRENWMRSAALLLGCDAERKLTRVCNAVHGYFGRADARWTNYEGLELFLDPDDPDCCQVLGMLWGYAPAPGTSLHQNVSRQADLISSRSDMTACGLWLGENRARKLDFGSCPTVYPTRSGKLTVHASNDPDMCVVLGRMKCKTGEKELTLQEIRKAGIEALTRELGPAGMARFMRQFERGSGDYTKERRELFERCTGSLADEILKSREKMP